MSDPKTTQNALNAAFASGDTAAVIGEVLAGEAARSVLDIGCGRGLLARSLLARGLAVTGIDPSETAVAAARASAPEAVVEVGTAEALPFEDGRFDAAIFLNSLHHVPVAAMSTALAETARVTRPGGTILVVEPLAEGPYFEAMRPVEDESEIREAAGMAVADAVRAGRFTLRGNVVYQRGERFRDVGQFITRLEAVEPLRAAAVADNRSAVEARFEAEAEIEDGMHILVQPLRVYWLRVPGRRRGFGVHPFPTLPVTHPAATIGPHGATIACRHSSISPD
ncbi:class I SAM-dependent methyltransferase [Aurantimonas sp. A2-1-M11]|uniref:class I SAM-dependent methyltransferase n=1 Tax=Aurantimonas sp. A2-1-M11 TaxID=3113712 RepID=UPI002F923755